MLLQNIKTSLKRLANNKLYTIINIGGLSLSFAIAILILLYVYNELNVDKYHSNLKNIYRLANKKDKSIYTAAKFGDYISGKYPEIKYFSRYFEFAGVFQYGDNESIKFDHVAFMDSSSLNMFSINILKSSKNKLLRTNQSIIISENTAKKMFGESDPLGQTITFDGNFDYVIEGVYEDYPTNSSFKHEVIAYYPSIKFLWGYPDYNVIESEGNWSFTTFVMLNENVNKQELDKRLKEDLVERFKRPTEFYLQEFSDIYFNNQISDSGVSHGNKQIVYLFLTIALIIVTIAMINYINLSTSISTKRALSISVLKTLGAKRANLIIQFLVETIIICISSVILGYIIAELFMPTFNNLLQYKLEVKTFYTFPFNVISILIAIIIGLLSGLYPSVYLTRFSPVDIRRTNQGKSKGTGLFKKGLMVFQFIITIVLITGTILVYKQLHFWRNMDFGINKDHILLLNLNDNAEVFKESLEKLSGVEEICFSNGTAGNVTNGLYDIIDDQEISMRHLYVDADFFNMYSIEIIDGVGFSKDNPDINSKKYILNEAAVKYLNWESAYDKKIWGWECIGIVKDFNFASPHNEIGPLFISFNKISSTINIKLVPNTLTKTMDQIKDIWDEMYPEFPFEYQFVDDVFNAYYKNEERLTKLLGYFAVFSIFIACLGLFGLISFMAEQRTKEIGIRKANGAGVSNIISLFSKEFVQLVFISGIIAIPLSYYMLTKWLQNFAYATKLSWWVFAFAIMLAILISSLSVFYRALKAATQNPVDALRYE